MSVHIAYGRGSVLLRRGDEIPRKEQFWGFSFPQTMYCNVFAANGIGRKGGDGSTQCGRSVIYDCLVAYVRKWATVLTFTV